MGGGKETEGDFMKKQSIEFYIGIFIWLLEIPISYSMWFAGVEIESYVPITLFNIVLAAALYLLFLVGYLTSYGIFQHQLKRKTIILGIILSSVATLGLSMFFFFGMVALLATMTIIQLTPFVKQKHALLIAVLVPTLCVLIDVWHGKPLEFTAIIIYSTFNLLALLTSYRFVAESQAKNESEKLVRELKATQILLSASTKRDERLRIARDLHDVVGHQLTALSLQLEVASHVKEVEKQKHVQQAKAISTLLLSDVRETVSEIRQKKDLELREALMVLSQNIPGLTVDLHMELDESLADARQVEVIFRCVQEALTNTAKHSRASFCRIKLSSDDQYLSLSIKDNGGGPDNETPDIKPGNGLTGMIERVERIDGQLDYQNISEGFEISVKLPNNH